MKGDCKGGAWNRARLCEMEGASLRCNPFIFLHRDKKETQPRYKSNVGSLCSARLLRKFRE